MRKIQTYWRTLQKSISNPDYYIELYNSTLSFSLQFFLVSLLLISIVATVWWRFTRFPGLVDMSKKAVTDISNQIPDSFRAHYKDRKLTTEGVQLPFSIKMPPFAQSPDVELPKNILTVTNDDGATSSLFTVTPERLLLRRYPETGTDSVAYSDIFDQHELTLTKSELTQFLQGITTFVASNALIFALGFWGGSLLASLVGGIILIAIYSVILQSVAWLFGLRLTYGYMFRWGLHIYPIAIGIDTLSLMLSPTNHFSLVSLTYIVVSIVILWRAKTKLKHRTNAT